MVSGCGRSGTKVEDAVEAKTPVTVTSPLQKSMSESLEFPAVSAYIRKNIIRSSTTGRVETCDIATRRSGKKRAAAVYNKDT